MERRWRIRPHDEARITALERAAGVSPVVAKLLLARGICNPQQAGIFLDAQLTGLREPDLLPGLTAAVDRLHAALQQKRRIVVYGDYDADGMTATGLLVCCLRLLGANVGYHVPNRLEEGYGLNDESLGKLASQGASVVVSVDCGIGSVAAAETARQLGLELIVTDHHELRDDGLLPAAAAMLMLWAPISVLLRTCLATEKLRWNSWLSCPSSSCGPLSVRALPWWNGAAGYRPADR